MGQQQLNKRKKGYITLISVIILGFVSIMIISSALIIGTDSLATSKVILNGSEADAIANACAESALSAIRENTSFTGTQNVSLANGTCTYVVTNVGAGTPANKNIRVTATVGDVVKKIEIVTSQINPTIEILTWNKDAIF